MNRVAFFPLAAFALALPLAAQAQAFRCPDPATGKVLYTDQPCTGGDLVVPAPTAEELERRRQAEAQAQERRAAERQQALEAERLRLERERLELERSAVQAAQPQNSAACRQAQQNAEQVAGSRGSSTEQIRTARYNAALACGQQPPVEVVETTTVVRQPYYGGRYYTGYSGWRTPYYNTPSYGGYISGRSGSVNWGVGFGSGGVVQQPRPGFAPQPPRAGNVRPGVVQQPRPGAAPRQTRQPNTMRTTKQPARANP